MTTTRAAAQARVVRRAGELSAELLIGENRAQQRCAEIFAARVPRAKVRKVETFRNSRTTRSNLGIAHRQAVSEVVGEIETMCRDAGALSSKAIEAELRYLERSMAAAYRGRTVTTMLRVDPSAVVERALDLTTRLTVALQEQFEAKVTDAASRAKTPEQITDWLVGRGRPQGAWWGSSTALQQHIRWISIATANAVRHTAMREFNLGDAA